MLNRAPLCSELCLKVRLALGMRSIRRCVTVGLMFLLHREIFNLTLLTRCNQTPLCTTNLISFHDNSTKLLRAILSQRVSNRSLDFRMLRRVGRQNFLNLKSPLFWLSKVILNAI